MCTRNTECINIYKHVCGLKCTVYIMVKLKLYLAITDIRDDNKIIIRISGLNSHGPAQALWQVYVFPWQSKPSSGHITINREKDEELTFVATGNRSQAKEEEGEKIHSVHLREERKGIEGQQGGWGRGGVIQYMHQQLISTRRDRYKTEKERHKQIRPIRWRLCSKT